MIGVVNQVGELLAVTRAAARIGVQDDITLGGPDLRVQVEDEGGGLLLLAADLGQIGVEGVADIGRAQVRLQFGFQFRRNRSILANLALAIKTRAARERRPECCSDS